MAYPAPKHRKWEVQIEFLDGTTIDASSDEDAIERWRRIASWTDETIEADPTAWMDKILARCRSFYGARLPGITSACLSGEILDALSAENCLSVRRKG